ncbi:hypothetical protein ACFC00_23575 [Streptomyces adustus]|uniref:hypothetical protein n=1 Tax=Streptomyces adustus TaxID=1609272 RepID=UPI0035DDC65B
MAAAFAVEAFAAEAVVAGTVAAETVAAEAVAVDTGSSAAAAVRHREAGVHGRMVK